MKKNLIIATIAVILIACGAGAYCYFGIYKPAHQSSVSNNVVALDLSTEAGNTVTNTQDNAIKETPSEATKETGSTGTTEVSKEESTTVDNPVTEETPAVTETTQTSDETSEMVSTEEVPVTITPAPTTESGTPVANHGKLKVSGTDLVDASGKKYQIKGVSTHGIGWFPAYVNKEGFRTMRDEWGINCVRLAMYSGEGAGYATTGDKTALKTTMNNGISYCTELGLYVIIDWHVLGDQNPNTYKTEAISFFDEMSKKYASYDNVLYEICNEPNGGTTWAQVKSYAEEVIPVIKANDPNAIIIVGTPTWSQDVDQAAANPITGYTNIMYTLHFYADTHKSTLRNRMVTAKKTIPIFCTEFGICDASGSGSNNIAEGNSWIKTMDDNNISYCIWSLCNKAETASLISSNCNKLSGWTETDLSEVGKWYVGILGNGVPLGTTSTTAAETTDNNNNNSNNNNATTQTPAAQATSANTEASLVNSGGWQTDGGQCTQYTLNVKNTGTGAVKDWKVTITFGCNVTLDQSWSGDVSVSGSTVTITGADFNKQIASGSSAEVGFIVKYSGNIGTPKVTIQ